MDTQKVVESKCGVKLAGLPADSTAAAGGLGGGHDLCLGSLGFGGEHYELGPWRSV